ncbi:FMR1-interacting protein NUFIP2-like [Monodelphis domestica]|uniref:FMR1-interacting protein NUFIP2-like n=1 Tax=Monodelphis domestica TaxID=13616 RepID=UPI0024E24E96|nr:FMR1-interacting protein NUFIP2-like [Monodelphis domestica]
MEGGQIPLQAWVPVQNKRQKKRVKGNPQAQAQNEQEKPVQNPRKVQQGMIQDPKALVWKSKHQKAQPYVKRTPTIEVSTPEEVESIPKSLSGNEDKKLARAVADKPPKAQALNNPKTSGDTLNQVKAKPFGSPANGQEDREADKHDSDWDSSYSGHKQQKPRFSLPNVGENFHLTKASMKSQEPRCPVSQQRPDNLKLTGSNHRGIRVGTPRPPVCNPRSTGASPGHRNNQKPLPTKPDLSSPNLDTWSQSKPTPPTVPKEENQGLCKQPAIFPGSNYTVPEVSYASKVKQNLCKVPKSFISSGLASEPLLFQPQTSALVESPILPPGQRLSQVPGSPLGPVNPLGSLNRPEQNMPMDACLMKCPMPNLKSKVSPRCPGIEQSFTCPSMLITTTKDLMPNCRSSQIEAQMLRDIVKNKWGLSFISEIDIEPETAQEMASEAQVKQPTLPHKCPTPSPLAAQETAGNPTGAEHLKHSPHVCDVNKWLNPQGSEGIIKLAILKSKSDEAFIPVPSIRDDLQEADQRSTGSFMLLCNENQLDSSEPFTLSLDPILKEAEKKDEWKPFDFRAAVEYHMAEMKSVWDLQKKDPLKVIIYDESLDL